MENSIIFFSFRWFELTLFVENPVQNPVQKLWKKAPKLWITHSTESFPQIDPLFPQISPQSFPQILASFPQA